jgi:hypothetical protein
MEQFKESLLFLKRQIAFPQEVEDRGEWELGQWHCRRVLHC